MYVFRGFLVNDLFLYFRFKNCQEVGYAARRPTKNSVPQEPSIMSDVREKSSLHAIQNKEGSNMKSGIQKTPSPRDSNKNAQVSVSGNGSTQFNMKVEQRSLLDEASDDGSSIRASPSNRESRQHSTSNAVFQSSHLKVNCLFMHFYLVVFNNILLIINSVGIS